MKNIKDILLENNNEDTARYFEVVKSKLPELQTLFINKLEINKKDFDLKVRLDNNKIVLYVEDLMNLCGTLGKNLFDEVYLEAWGGVYSKEENGIYFYPRIKYHFLMGGGNGNEFLWNYIYFDCEKNTWETSRK